MILFGEIIEGEIKNKFIYGFLGSAVGTTNNNGFSLKGDVILKFTCALQSPKSVEAGRMLLKRSLQE